MLIIILIIQILVQTYFHTSIYIANNVYHRCNTGTNLADIQGSYVVVRNNRYNQGLAYNYDDYGYVAINCYSKMPTRAANIYIEGNRIYNTSIGIHVRNIDHPVIHVQNTWDSDMPNADIPLYAAAHNNVPQRGIWIENCPLAYIDNNSITRNNYGIPQYTSGAMESELMIGIGVDQSTVTSVKNNHTFNMGTDINVYNNCMSSEIRCNGMTSSFRGINFFTATFVTGPDYGSPTDASDNFWVGEYLNNTNTRIDGDFANTILPVNWYHQGILDPSNPLCPFYHSSAINPIDNATSTGCPHFPGDDHERLRQNIREAALNNTSYAEYIPENIFADDQTSFEKAKDDTTLLQMFGGLQSVINQWYTAQRQGNIGKYKDVKDYIAARNFQAAQIAAMSIVDTTVILQNMRLVLQIYLDHYYDENSTPPGSAAIAQLENIAHQTVAQGGEAVYIARAMLGIDVQDILPIGLRKASDEKNILKNETQLILNPNPAKSICHASFNCKADYLLVEDVLGKQINLLKIADDAPTYTFNLDKYHQGVYTIKLIQNKTVIASQKLVIIK